MTKQREALEQALSALIGSGYYDTSQQRAAINAVRSALAEPDLELELMARRMKEYLDTVDYLARQCCHTASPAALEPNITDSGAISAYADALELLDSEKRFRITRGVGRMVCGYWPENDPVKITSQKGG